jgi:hypothetical protein
MTAVQAPVEVKPTAAQKGGPVGPRTRSRTTGVRCSTHQEGTFPSGTRS